MQDVRTGVEGLIAVIQIGGNRIVSTNPSGRLAGILNRYDLVDVVRSLGLAVGVFFSLSGADDGHENLISRIRNKAGMVLITLLLDQVDFYAAGGECVGLVVGVGEVGQRGTDDGDGGQRHAQEQGSDLLFHVIALLFLIFWVSECARDHLITC